MNKVIKCILSDNISNDMKRKRLNDLSNEIQIAKDIIDGKYKYCQECNDYYITESFFNKNGNGKAKICIYSDQINGGGNDYTDGYEDITYSICPKGHKHEISRNERY